MSSRPNQFFPCILTMMTLLFTFNSWANDNFSCPEASDFITQLSDEDSVVTFQKNDKWLLANLLRVSVLPAGHNVKLAFEMGETVRERITHLKRLMVVSHDSLIFKDESPKAHKYCTYEIMLPVEDKSGHVQFNVTIELLSRYNERVFKLPGLKELFPEVIARKDWEAQEFSWFNLKVDGRKKMATIGHTVLRPEMSSGYNQRIYSEFVRKYQNKFVLEKEMPDQPYHFLITKDGHIFEGRPYPFIGAGAPGRNVNNLSIGLIGEFDGSLSYINLGDDLNPLDEVTPEIIQSVANVLAYFSVAHDLQLDLVFAQYELYPNHEKMQFSPGEGFLKYKIEILKKAREKRRWLINQYLTKKQ